MQIKPSTDDFTAENFEIVSFANKTTCFLWSKTNFVFFDWDKYDETSSINLQVFNLDKSIKAIKGLEGFVSVLCSPTGMYRMKSNQRLVSVSETAIVNVNKFFQYLSFKENYIFFEDKVLKASQKLLTISESNVSSIKSLTLINEESDENLKRWLEKSPDVNSTILVISNKIYKLNGNETNLQQIYSSLSNITDIFPLFRNNKVAGFVIATELKYIVVFYIKHSKLFSKRLYLNNIIKSLVAGFCENSGNTIWILYSSPTNLYFGKKDLDKNGFVEYSDIKKTQISSLKYFNNCILALDDRNCLLKLSYAFSDVASVDSDDDFKPLEKNMMKGSDVIMDSILEKAQELQSLNETLMEKQSLLNRISLHSHQQRNSYLPEIFVSRTPNFLALQFKFSTLLPDSCLLIVNVTSKKQTVFATKVIDADEMIVEVPLPSNIIHADLNISVDLATYGVNRKTWCLIEDYLVEPELTDQSKFHSLLDDKRNFVEVKLNSLNSLMEKFKEDSHDSQDSFDKICAIKAAVRNEIPF